MHLALTLVSIGTSYTCCPTLLTSVPSVWVAVGPRYIAWRGCSCQVLLWSASWWGVLLWPSQIHSWCAWWSVIIVECIKSRIMCCLCDSLNVMKINTFFMGSIIIVECIKSRIMCCQYIQCDSLNVMKINTFFMYGTQAMVQTIGFESFLVNCFGQFPTSFSY